MYSVQEIVKNFNVDAKSLFEQDKLAGNVG